MSLINAICNKNTEMVKFLIEKGAKIDENHYYYNKLICMMINDNNIEMVKLLIEKGVKINTSYFDGNEDCPLYFAIVNNNIEIVKLLIEKGAEINTQANYFSYRNKSPLLMSVKNNNIEIARLLIEKGADPNDGDEIIKMVIEKDNVELVRFMIDKNIQINYYYDIIFQWACDKGHIDIMKYIMKDNVANSALFEKIYRNALENGNVRIAKLLIDNNNSFYKENYSLKHILDNNYFNVIDFLVDNTVLNSNNIQSIFQWASTNGYIDIVKKIIDKKIYFDIHFQNDIVLRKAAENGHIKMVRLLVEQGADIHSVDDYALRWASDNGHYEIVNFLIEKGANIHAQNNYAIKWATKKGHTEVVELLNRKLGYSTLPSAPPLDYNANVKQCEICMENIISVFLPCSHSLCQNCFVKIDRLNNLCPFCRTVIDT